MCPDISCLSPNRPIDLSLLSPTNDFLAKKLFSEKISKNRTKMTKTVVLLSHHQPTSATGSTTPNNVTEQRSNARNCKTPAEIQKNARKNSFSLNNNNITDSDNSMSKFTKTSITTTTMKAEVDAAVSFLTYLLVKAQFSIESAELFRQALTELLRVHYVGHWYPQEPLKGSGYRCLRVNGVMHPLLAKTADLCKLPLQQFRRAFPAELTVWVDPGDVSVRFGEEGSIGVFYAKQDENAKNGILLKNNNHHKNRLNFCAEDIDKAILDGNFSLLSQTTPNGKRKVDQQQSLPSNNSNRNSPDYSKYSTSPSNGGFHHQNHYHHPAGGYHASETPNHYHHRYQQHGYQSRYHGNVGFWNQQQQTPPQHQDFRRTPPYGENQSSPQHHNQMFVRRLANETCNMEYQLYGNVHMASEISPANLPTTVQAARRVEPVGAV